MRHAGSRPRVRNSNLPRARVHSDTVEVRRLDTAVHKLNSQHNALTRPLRTAAAKQGRAEFLSLWTGQGVLRAVDVILCQRMECFRDGRLLIVFPQRDTYGRCVADKLMPGAEITFYKPTPIPVLIRTMPNWIVGPEEAVTNITVRSKLWSFRLIRRRKSFLRWISHIESGMSAHMMITGFRGSQHSGRGNLLRMRSNVRQFDKRTRHKINCIRDRRIY